PSRFASSTPSSAATPGSSAPRAAPGWPSAKASDRSLSDRIQGLLLLRLLRAFLAKGSAGVEPGNLVAAEEAVAIAVELTEPGGAPLELVGAELAILVLVQGLEPPLAL